MVAIVEFNLFSIGLQGNAEIGRKGGPQMRALNPPLPPFTLEGALAKVQAVEDDWDTCELIVEKGYAQTTAKDISLRAGYSRAMVAERFGSKDRCAASRPKTRRCYARCS